MQLPVELIQLILENLGRPEILTMRLLNILFCASATPIAFRELGVADTVRSAQRFEGLQSNPHIASCVKSVVFRTILGAQFDMLALITVRRAMSRLSQLPQLSSLRFEFHPTFDEQIPDFTDDKASPRLKRQRAVLTAACSAPLPMLKSLTLINLMTLPSELFTSDAFEALLRPLDTLSIETLGPRYYSGGVREGQPIAKFWTQMTTSISTLHLRSSHLISLSPKLIFPSSSFPNLTTLHLTKVCCSRDTVEFILRHPGLRELALQNCPLDPHIKSGDYYTSWVTILEMLDAGLESLVQISIFDLKYCLWSGIVASTSGDTFGLDAVLDQRALEKWTGNVALRRGAGNSRE
ncbi:hypothetical protein FB45DRAFT_1033514 [Roridomyces roridus]|uniref:F-box domain-containing protein n=1 Tax=Roridomyces roridus TaxID=1738132 RepID=A0AAD7FH18_9AGAR|nr:hypothetical protein FB45DRAFT_1033514 [Roridomyces roridus]